MNIHENPHNKQLRHRGHAIAIFLYSFILVGLSILLFSAGSVTALIGQAH